LRSTTDVLRRGFDSMLANWPLIAIRIAESLVFVMIVIGSIVAMIIPIAVTAGLSRFDLKNADNPASAVAALIVEHWALIFYIFVIVTVLLIVLVALHSFVEAGNTKVFVDAERAAARVAQPSRDTFRAFAMDRWLLGGRNSWWSIFWIYNIVWAVGGLILLIPLLLTIFGMIAVDEPGPRVAMGCGGLAITLLFLIPISIVIAIWTQKAIAVCVARTATASESLKLGWDAIRGDFGRHFAVAFIIFVIAFGGAMALSMFTMPISMLRSGSGAPPFINIAFAPAQIVTSLAQTILSSAVGLWFLAAYVGLTEER
jgi:hypothetical protein